MTNNKKIVDIQATVTPSKKGEIMSEQTIQAISNGAGNFAAGVTSVLGNIVNLGAKGVQYGAAKVKEALDRSKRNADVVEDLAASQVPKKSAAELEEEIRILKLQAELRRLKNEQ